MPARRSARRARRERAPAPLRGRRDRVRGGLARRLPAPGASAARSRCAATEGAELYVLAELGPGHAFGELAVLDRTPRTATVVAVLDSETVQIGAVELDAVLEAHPAAVRQMLGVLARLLIEEKELVIRDNWMLERRVRERTQDLRNSQLEIVHRLGQVAESRDPETGRHITRMSRVCAHLAKTIGMAPADCETLLHAAPMHDIGKVGVPDSILHKAGPLDDVERDRMRLHPTVGAEILSGSRSPIVRMAEEIALTHHERWDGSGYPRGLRGTEIPLVGPHLRGRRRLRRADLRPLVQARVVDRRRARGAPAPGGEAARPRAGRGARERARRPAGADRARRGRVRDALGAAQQHGLALAAAAAHRGDAERGAVAAHLVGEREDEAEAGGGERVAERDRAAVDVDLLGVDPQRAGARHGDAGERLVDLPQVDVARVAARGARAACCAASAGRRCREESGPATTARPTTSASGSWPAARARPAVVTIPAARAVGELRRVARRDRALAREGGRRARPRRSAWCPAGRPRPR